MSLHIKYFDSYFLHAVLPQAAHSTQMQLACTADEESSGTKKKNEGLLCLTLMKKLFKPFVVEIRVVGLRPDVSTVTVV